MNSETVVNIISTVGFPIVCCIFLWKYINTIMEDYRKMMSENNAVISSLCDKIDLILNNFINEKRGGEDNEN